MPLFFDVLARGGASSRCNCVGRHVLDSALLGLILFPIGYPFRAPRRASGSRRSRATSRHRGGVLTLSGRSQGSRLKPMVAAQLATAPLMIGSEKLGRAVMVLQVHRRQLALCFTDPPSERPDCWAQSWLRQTADPASPTSGARSPALIRDRRSCPSSRLLWRDIFTDESRDEQSIWTRRHGKPQACDQRPFWSVAEGKAQQGSRSGTGCATAPEANGKAQSGRSLSFGQRSHGGAEEMIGRHRSPASPQPLLHGIEAFRRVHPLREGRDQVR
jgi:hypothetical protein